jgi:hypothetical protein
MNSRIVRRALRDMDLTEDQRAEIDRIVDKTTPEMRKLSIAFGDTLETLATDQFDSIKAVLDEEQAEVLDKRIEEFRARMRRRGGRRGHGPGRRDPMREDSPPGG